MRRSREPFLSDMPPIPENQTPAYKAAKMAVIILSILIILAVIGLVVGGITHLGRKKTSSYAGSTATFQLPAGARILATPRQPRRPTLRGRGAPGGEKS